MDTTPADNLDMVHIDAATLRRYPIIGVLLGGVTTVLMVHLIASGWPEVRDLLGQRAPDRISVHDAVNLHRVRWVTLAEGEWHCDQAIAMKRSQGIERWFRGPIESTEVPITGTTRGELMVASFDGTLKCEERAGSPLTGVVGSTEIFTSRATLRRWRENGDRVAVLNVGATPTFAVIMLAGLIAITALGIGFCGYYLRLMFRSGRQPARLPTYEPIQ